ncbi:MAG TPA: hypothetical protein VMI94_17080 [Bryobacteraceae bacterium]|nr:hypothetical protein [Bryobacteraceae bacterium]
MGQEVSCKVQFNGQTAAGKALLETDDLIFRGAIRLSIPLKEIQSLDATDGVLRVNWPGGAAAFALGAQAEKWAHKIRHPRTLADKLDVKPGLRVSLVGVADADFRAQVAARTGDITEGKAAKESDLILFGAEAVKDLARVARLAAAIKRQGAIWIVYPKGLQTITEHDVRGAGLAAGLVDVKVARFSPTHTALKFVIPVGKR